MIVSKAINIPRLLRHVGLDLMVLLLYDVAVTLSYTFGKQSWVSIKDLPLPLLGSAIGLMLTLRNNTAYGRWWEGRTLWGAIVNNSRNFARSVMAMIDDRAEQEVLVRHQIAYVHALRAHLLRASALDKIASLLPRDALERVKAAANVPNALQMAIAGRLANAARGGAIDSIELTALNEVLSELVNAQGGLERIKNTPLPRHYSQLPRLFTIVYCLLLPVGLVGDLELLTPIGSTLIGFMFLTLDRTGRDLEDPFDGSIHDVPMLAITTTIEIDLLQAIKMPNVPKPLAVENGILV